MSTDNVFDLFLHTCKNLHGGKPPIPPVEHSYRALLIRDDVSLGDLAHALRFSGIVISTHAASHQLIIHRPTPPKDAA